MFKFKLSFKLSLSQSQILTVGLLSLISEATEGKYELDMTYTAQVVALMEVDEQMKNDLK